MRLWGDFERNFINYTQARRPPRRKSGNFFSFFSTFFYSRRTLLAIRENQDAHAVRWKYVMKIRSGNICESEITFVYSAPLYARIQTIYYRQKPFLYRENAHNPTCAYYTDVTWPTIFNFYFNTYFENSVTNILQYTGPPEIASIFPPLLLDRN